MTASSQTATVEPLRFEDGALLVLDQRALPGEERWIRCSSPEQVADCIRTLAVRGAPAIGLAAAYGLALADDREAAAELLRSTRPTAVNLAWALEQCRDAPDVLEAARRLHREQHEADRRLAELGAELFDEGTRALTHCNAGALATGGYGTACGVLRAAWEHGRLAEVWVDETRPLLQGARLTAWELRKAGIPHRVVADSAAGSLMARGLVDRIVVGRRPHRGERRRGEQGRHLPAGRAGGSARRSLLRGRAACRRSTRRRPTAPRSRSRSATRPRSWRRARPSIPPST